MDNEEFENCIRNGIINYGPAVASLLEKGSAFVEQVRNSSRTPLVNILLEGKKYINILLTFRTCWKWKDSTCF